KLVKIRPGRFPRLQIVHVNYAILDEQKWDPVRCMAIPPECESSGREVKFLGGTTKRERRCVVHDIGICETSHSCLFSGARRGKQMNLMQALIGRANRV